ncbi:MAG: VOC family protein [Pseudomonadales bacterium]|nr:VOC family protein [Pseudomonadales bacterium]
MLANAELQTLALTADIPTAITFYEEVLGLSLKANSDGAAVFDVGGRDLRVSPVAETSPTEHTVFGFAVADVQGVAEELSSKGVPLVEFQGFPHDQNGLVATPDGSRVCWFRDPDGNLISVVQYPT